MDLIAATSRGLEGIVAQQLGSVATVDAPFSNETAGLETMM
jgi:hypothetical protein